MPPLLLILALLCQLTGFFMHAQTYKYRTPDYPWLDGWDGFKVRNWRPVWKMSQYYKPPGNRLRVWSMVLFGLGCFIQLTVYTVWGHGPY